MNDGIKILLERLKTHPEEFKDDENPFSYEGKWMRIFEKYKHNLSKEDVDTFLEAFNTLRQEQFTAEVMAELLDPKQEEQLTLSSTKLANVTHLGGATLGRSSAVSNNVNTVTLTNQTNGATGTWCSSATTAQEYQMEQMKAHLEAHKLALKAEEQKKKHKTLFGKLFNYQ